MLNAVMKNPYDTKMTTITTTTTTTNTSSINTQQSASILPVNDLDVIQDMIDISADRLEGLRTQCVTSATLTQQEIRSLETKLVRMFSELLLTKARLNERIPANGLAYTTGSELKQWLRVVGLSNESLTVCLQRLSTLEQLLEQTDEDLKHLLSHNVNHKEEDLRRLTKAMQNLRKCKDYLKRKYLENNSRSNNRNLHAVYESEGELLLDNLYWDSWDRHQNHHHHHHHRSSMGNIGASLNASPRFQRMLAKQQQQQQQQQQMNKNKIQNSPSPPNSPFSSGSIIGGSLNGTPQRMRPAGTPPPIRKLQTNVKSITPTHHGNKSTNQQSNYEQHALHFSSTTLPLAKSRSNEAPFHDSILSAASSPPSLVTIGGVNISNAKTTTMPRTRLYTEPSPDSYSSSASSDILSAILTENNNNNNNSNNNNNINSLQVPPRSPCTSIVTLGMGHTISHRFTKVFKMMSTCSLCQKQMFFGLKCKECKYRCHKDCEINVPPSCGLPSEFVNEFKRTFKAQLNSNESPNNAVTNITTSPSLNTPLGKKRIGNSGITKGADSSSPGSSCNSSSPSSPALLNLQQQQQHYHQQQQLQQQMAQSNLMSSSGGGSSSASSNMLSTPSSFYNKSSSQFNFPDVTITTSNANNCNQSISGNGKGNDNISCDTTQTLYSATANSNDDF